MEACLVDCDLYYCNSDWRDFQYKKIGGHGSLSQWVGKTSLRGGLLSHDDKSFRAFRASIYWCIHKINTSRRKEMEEV